MTLPEEFSESAILLDSSFEEFDAGLPEAAAQAIAIPLLAPSQLGQAFEEFYPRLLAVALRFCRNEADAQDVVQNSFEKALRNRHQFRGDSKISTWLHRIVANEALMWLRSKKRHPTESDEVLEMQRVPEDTHPDAEDQIEEKQLAALLHGAMEGLGDEDYAILERCALGDESYGDFGSAMRLHPAAVKTRAFRARRRLRELLEHAIGPDIADAERQRMSA